MALKLMYITNRTDVAQIAEASGVDRIFVDMEYIGKDARQAGLDSVKNHHTAEDAARVRKAITSAELLVRVNPIHDQTAAYGASEEEIEAVLAAGADIIMLPYFRTAEEVRRFLAAVNGRAKTMLLLETPEAAAAIDEITALPGIDEIHIGINDLSLGMKKRFMFELLTDGTVEALCLKLRLAGIPYGFGGIAAVGSGQLPAEAILREHYRLGSSMVILSRSFCRIDGEPDLPAVRETFDVGVRRIRALEEEIAVHSRYFEDNRAFVCRCVDEIAAQLAKR